MNKIDLSFVISLKCNIECPFCMYNSNPRIKEKIDLKFIEKFINNIQWNKINQVGLFGGEISLFLKENEYILNNIPNNIPIMIITNGVWSKNKKETINFINFINKYSNIKKIKISNTVSHNKYQDIKMLKDLSKRDNRVKIKSDDTFEKLNPMGKLEYLKNDCSKICLNKNKIDRYTIMPNLDVLYQYCDGKHPIIGNLKNLNFEDLLNLRIEEECNYLKGYPK